MDIRRMVVALVGMGGVLSSWVSAAEKSEPLFVPPVWSIIPFVGILLSIAVLPVFWSEWWARHYGKVSAAWGTLTLVLMLVSLPSHVGFGRSYQPEIFKTVEEYVSFIILLGTLFIISGGILIRGGLGGRPLSNTLTLGFGAVLASLIGTTGATMLLILPLIRSNRWRSWFSHVMIFMIFIVANIGGLLTPLGDPPLFIGFLEGVPFLWTLRLFPHWLLAVVVLLSVFFVIDRHLFNKEKSKAPAPQKFRLQVEGRINLLLLLGVVGCVLGSGLIHLGTFSVGPLQLHGQNLLRDILMATLAALSLRLTPAAVRKENHFNFHPIKEVAYLFAGIFMTMIPALMLLQARGTQMGLHSASQFFWTSGALSSFLDNTPAYMTLLRTIRGLLGLDVAGVLTHPMGVTLLKGISVGSVFMGANTYIGNGPNFMVKSIAEQQGIRMPSFLGYMAWSGLILLPLFFVVDLVFFLGR